MELRNDEIVAVVEVANKVAVNAVSELDELELALVGGGIGDVILA